MMHKMILGYGAPWLGVLIVSLSLGVAAPGAAGERSRVLVEPETSSRSIVQGLQRNITVQGTTETPSPQEVSLMIPIEFDFDRATLRPEARSLLGTVASALNDPALSAERFVVEGHTDAVGQEAYNQQLSERRAEAVVNYLTQAGVARHRLAPIGYGQTRLLPGIAPTEAANRRVELLRLAR